MNYPFGKGLDALARCAVEETVQMLEEIGISVAPIDAEEMILRLAASDRFSRILLDMSDTEDSRGETFLDNDDDDRRRPTTTDDDRRRPTTTDDDRRRPTTMRVRIAKS